MGGILIDYYLEIIEFIRKKVNTLVPMEELNIIEIFDITIEGVNTVIVTFCLYILKEDFVLI